MEIKTGQSLLIQPILNQISSHLSPCKYGLNPYQPIVQYGQVGLGYKWADLDFRLTKKKKVGGFGQVSKYGLGLPPLVLSSL